MKEIGLKRVTHMFCKFTVTQEQKPDRLHPKRSLRINRKYNNYTTKL